MVGVQLPRPANNNQGYAVMIAARQELQTHFGDVCEVVKDDQSAIKLKLRWQHSLFTITLTSNTGYIFIQGPNGKLLPLAETIRDLVGGVIYVARQPGVAPHNPSMTSATSDHEDDMSEATAHGTTQATVHGTPVDGATEATVHGATGQAAAEAAIHGASEQASMPNASQTATSSVAPSSSGTVSSSPITGSDNIQVGTLVINTQSQDVSDDISTQNVVDTLITGMMNLLRGGATRGLPTGA